MDFLNDISPQLISLLTAINAMALSMLFMLAGRNYPEHISRSMLMFSYGKMAVAAGFAVAAARGDLPLPMVIILANALGVMGFYSNYAAALTLQGKAQNWRLPVAVLAVAVVGCGYFTLIDLDLTGVRMVVSGTIALLIGLLTVELLVRYRLDGSAHIMAGIIALVVGMAFLTRFYTALLALITQQPLSPDSPVEKVFLLTALLGATLGAVSFLLMCNDAFNSELRRQNATDPLTGLVNRHRLLELGDEAVTLSRRHSQPLSLMMVDIDQLKTINDRWGPATGDRAIQGLTKTFRQVLSDDHPIGRVGGEEFVLLLPNTDHASAVAVAERLCERLTNISLESDNHQPLSITISIGIASWCGEALFQDLLRRADSAMAQAKRAGGNRISSADPRPPLPQA